MERGWGEDHLLHHYQQHDEATFEVDIPFDEYSNEISWVLENECTGEQVIAQAYSAGETSDVAENYEEGGENELELEPDNFESIWYKCYYYHLEVLALHAYTYFQFTIQNTYFKYEWMNESKIHTWKDEWLQIQIYF